MTEIPEPTLWKFSVHLTVKNETAAIVDVKAYGLFAYDDALAHALAWGIDETYTNHPFANNVLIPPGEAKTLSTGAECYSHSTADRIARMSFLLKLSDDKWYAGWDAPKFGNKVCFDGDTVTEVKFSGSGYGYILAENEGAAGLWYSTLPPQTLALKRRVITAAYAVTITDAGASFDSVTLGD